MKARERLSQNLVSCTSYIYYCDTPTTSSAWRKYCCSLSLLFPFASPCSSLQSVVRSQHFLFAVPQPLTWKFLLCTEVVLFRFQSPRLQSGLKADSGHMVNGLFSMVGKQRSSERLYAERLVPFSIELFSCCNCFSIFSLFVFDTHCAISAPTEHIKSSHGHQWNRWTSFSWPWGTETTFSSVTFPVIASHDVFYLMLIALAHWCCNHLHFLFSKTFKAVYALVFWCITTANANSYLMVQDGDLIAQLPITIWITSFPENWYEEKRAAWRTI